MKYIGIDLGSSFIKAVLFDLQTGRVLESKRSHSPGRLSDPNPLVFEIPADQMLSIVKEQIDDYTRRYDGVEGIILSTQMHGFVYSAKGMEDMYVSWQDMRCMDDMPGEGCSFLEHLEQVIPLSRMEDHGVYLKPSLGFCNLYALLKEKPEVAPDGEMFTLGSYVIYRLTGNNICHKSNAAPLGLLDVRNERWDTELMAEIGLGSVRLPRRAESDYEVCGLYRSNGQELKVHPDYGDMQISILGSDIGKGDVVCNVATGAQVIRYGSEFTPGGYEIRPFFDNSYLYTISNMPAGRNVDVLIRFLKEAAEQITGETVEESRIWDVVHESLDEHTQELRVQSSFYKNPYFPDGGAITGITHTNLHIGNLFRATFRDMAETYWHFIKQLGAPEEEITRIICAGGACWKNPQLREEIAKATLRTTVTSPIPDEALAGMYHVALVCSGKASSLEACRDERLIME